MSPGTDKSQPGTGIYIWAALAVCLVLLSLAMFLTHQNPAIVFALSAVAIIPLAAIMGRSTEELAIHSGPAVGGLLNATFGNAAELIIALFALKEGLVAVVQASITGSIIGNILLVLGLSMVAGGAKFKKQTISKGASSASLLMLVFMALALIMPALYYYAGGSALMGAPLPQAKLEDNTRSLSLGVAVVLVVVYFLGLIFSHRTHRHLFSPADEEKEKARWGKGRSILVLLAATALVALMSEVLVTSVDDASGTLGLSHIFVGVVIVAIVGNVAEHSTAILMALKDKMELAFQISVGSAAQIAMFVAPVLVFAGYAMGVRMHLAFEPLELAAILAAVFAATVALIDGESNWFEGTMFVAVYLIIAMAFYFHP